MNSQNKAATTNQTTQTDFASYKKKKSHCIAAIVISSIGALLSLIYLVVMIFLVANYYIISISIGLVLGTGIPLVLLFIFALTIFILMCWHTSSKYKESQYGFSGEFAERNLSIHSQEGTNTPSLSDSEQSKINELAFLKTKQARWAKGILISALFFAFSICYLVGTILLTTLTSITFMSLAFSLFTGIPLVICGIIALVTSIIKYVRISAQCKTIYVDLVLHPVFRQRFGNEYIYKKEGISNQEFDSMHLMGYHNLSSTEDAIYATYKGKPFMQADIDITTTKTDSDGHTESVTIYNGQVMRYQSKKPISGRVYIHMKNAACADLVKRQLQKVETESESFNEKYCVYATDPHEAFYVLTPQLMDVIPQVYYGAHFVALNFEQDNICVAYNGSYTNLDDTTSGNSVNIAQMQEKANADLDRTFHIMDLFHNVV